MYSATHTYSLGAWRRAHSVGEFKVGDRVKCTIPGAIKDCKGVIMAINTKPEIEGLIYRIKQDVNDMDLFLLANEIELC